MANIRRRQPLPILRRVESAEFGSNKRETEAPQSEEVAESSESDEYTNASAAATAM